MEPLDSAKVVERIIMGSPLIVLLLLIGYIVLGRFIMALTMRLDKKDQQLLDVNREVVEAVTSVRSAVENLTEVVKNSHRPRM